MSTPTSSSGEEEKNSRMEYNALLANKRVAADGNFSPSSAGNTDFWDDKHAHLPCTESLDFEEVESMIWRKVRILSLCLQLRHFIVIERDHLGFPFALSSGQ